MVSHRLVSSLLGHLPVISALHHTASNLILRTVDALMAPSSEYMVWAAIFNLRKANIPPTNAISTLK